MTFIKSSISDSQREKHNYPFCDIMQQKNISSRNSSIKRYGDRKLKVGLLKNISRPVGRGSALPCSLVNMHLENLTGHLVTDLEHENIEIERDIWSEYTRNRDKTFSRCHLGRRTCTIWLDTRDLLYFGKWTQGEEVIWWLKNPYHREVFWFYLFLFFFLISWALGWN